MTGAILSLLALAMPAAAPTGGTATLVAPTAQRGTIVANGVAWHCAGTSCSGPASGYRTGDQRACKDLARQVGPIASFVSGAGALTATDLARCNERARPAG